jgi:hypothetical protein
MIHTSLTYQTLLDMKITFTSRIQECTLNSGERRREKGWKKEKEGVGECGRGTLPRQRDFIIAVEISNTERRGSSCFLTSPSLNQALPPSLFFCPSFSLPPSLVPLPLPLLRSQVFRKTVLDLSISTALAVSYYPMGNAEKSSLFWFMRTDKTLNSCGKFQKWFSRRTKGIYSRTIS